MEESCNFKFCKFCLSTIKQKNKSNTQIHLFKSKHSYSNKTFLESITKDETSHRIVKIVSKNSSCENYIDKVIKRINIKKYHNLRYNWTYKKKKILRQPYYTLELPKIILKPKTYTTHKCNYSCVNWINYDQNKIKPMNMLVSKDI